MNLLIQHVATIECWKKRVKFSLPKEKPFNFFCNKNIVSSLINTIKVGNCLRRSEFVFLAKIEVLHWEIYDLENIRVISKFGDVFFGELPNLSPEREVGFVIDLQLETSTIYKYPYKMTRKNCKN